MNEYIVLYIYIYIYIYVYVYVYVCMYVRICNCYGLCISIPESPDHGPALGLRYASPHGGAVRHVSPQKRRALCQDRPLGLQRPLIESCLDGGIRPNGPSWWHGVGQLPYPPLKTEILAKLGSTRERALRGTPPGTQKCPPLATRSWGNFWSCWHMPRCFLHSH